jgi:GNAT superfamily N-acetyltransferase
MVETHPAIRPFREEDRSFIAAFGAAAIDWWDQHVTLHLVAGTPVVAHLQIVDRGTTPERRPGRMEMRLTVAPDHRRRGIGSRLYERAEAFAQQRQARWICATYLEHSPREPALSFLKQRGFVELQRYCPAHLDVTACDLTPFEDREQRLIEQGARFFTYADVPDTLEHRQRLYALEQEARSDIPYRYPEPPEPVSFERWVQELERKEFATIELAEMDGRWVGLATSISWGFTGVARAYRGHGIATALKVRAIRSAKQRGLDTLETENHADNQGMMAINRKLGYRFGIPEVECVMWLR